MEKRNVPSAGWIFILIAVIILFIGVLSVFYSKKEAYAGFTWGGYNKIAVVEPGSPAEQAGMKAGDVLKSVDGIELGDPAEIRQSYPKIGETRTIIIERDGEQIGLDLTYSTLPGSDFTSRLIVQFALGLCFLACGLFAYFRNPSGVTILFALFCSFFSLNIFQNYLIANAYPWNMLLGAFQILVLFLAITTLLHYTLLFPKRKKMMEKKTWSRIMYLPPVPVILFILYLTFSNTGFSQTMFALLQGYFFLFIIGYLILAVISLIHATVKLTSQERRETGLNMMLVGTLIAVLPVIIGSILQIIAPEVSLPSEDYYGLTGIFLPLTWLRAIMKKEASG